MELCVWAAPQGVELAWLCGRQEGEAEVVPLTAVGVIGHSDDAHGLLGDVHTQELHVTAHILVGPLYCPSHPVRPEDVLPVHGQPEGVHGL